MADRLDFSRVVGSLLERGMTQRQLARALDVSVSTVNRWRNAGVEPRYGTGGQLVFLAANNEPEIDDLAK